MLYHQWSRDLSFPSWTRWPTSHRAEPAQQHFSIRRKRWGHDHMIRQTGPEGTSETQRSGCSTSSPFSYHITFSLPGRTHGLLASASSPFSYHITFSLPGRTHGLLAPCKQWTEGGVRAGFREGSAPYTAAALQPLRRTFPSTRWREVLQWTELWAGHLAIHCAWEETWPEVISPGSCLWLMVWLDGQGLGRDVTGKNWRSVKRCVTVLSERAKTWTY